MMPNPIKTREQAHRSRFFNLNEEYKQLYSMIPSTNTVFDCGFFCTLSSGTQEKARLWCVLQGPYNCRPYLPPVAGRFFAIAVRRDINLPLCDLTVRFWMRELKKKEPDALHEPAVLTTKMLRETLSFGVGENDTHCLTWAVNDKTDTLTWIMLVVKDEALLKMCESHMPRVEQFAHMDEEEFEREVCDRVDKMGEKNIQNLLSIHTRKLQIHFMK